MSDFIELTDEVLDWDALIGDGESASTWHVIEEGDYDFEVKATRKEDRNGTPVLAVDMAIDGIIVTDKIKVTKKMEWRIGALMRATGVKKHGEAMSLSEAMKKMVGCTGRCHVAPRNYPKNDGTQGTSNDIKKYFDKVERPERPAPKQEYAF